MLDEPNYLIELTSKEAREMAQLKSAAAKAHKLWNAADSQIVAYAKKITEERRVPPHKSPSLGSSFAIHIVGGKFLLLGMNGFFRVTPWEYIPEGK